MTQVYTRKGSMFHWFFFQIIQLLLKQENFTKPGTVNIQWIRKKNQVRADTIFFWERSQNNIPSTAST